MLLLYTFTLVRLFVAFNLASMRHTLQHCLYLCIVYLSHFTFLTVFFVRTCTIIIKYCSISKSPLANDSVLLDNVEYYTIAWKCSRLSCFRCPKRMRVAPSCGRSMYMYSIRLFSINVVSLHPGISREDVIIRAIWGILASIAYRHNKRSQSKCQSCVRCSFLSHSDKLSLHHAVGV